MHSEVFESVETHVVKLQGNWTIDRANELKDLLLEALGGEKDVIVDLEGVLHVDLSCLQLLCSAHRAFAERNRGFALADRKPETFKKAVMDAGYARTLGCHKDRTENCLWIGGWES